MRYVRQPTRSSCGPTAILNCLKWAGGTFSIRKHFASLVRLCETVRRFGTEVDDFSRALRFAVATKLRCSVVSVRKRNRPTLNELMEHLDRPGSAAVLLYFFPDVGYRVDRDNVAGHYTFLLRDEQTNKVVCINDRADETVTTTSRRALQSRLSFNRHDKECFPQVWLLRKR